MIYLNQASFLEKINNFSSLQTTHLSSDKQYQHKY